MIISALKKIVQCHDRFYEEKRLYNVTFFFTEEMGAVGHDPVAATVLSPVMEGSAKTVHGRFRHKLKMPQILGFVPRPRSPKPIVESNPPQTGIFSYSIKWS